jgi:hypothetical protein
MSNDEIKNNTPFLDQLKKKKSGFSIPEDYFENIESSILLNTKKSEWASNPFKVPQNYFEEIDSKVLNQIKDKKSNPIFTLNRFWIPVSIAAMLILNIGIFTFQKQEQSIEMADMENWLEDGTVDLNTYEIASVYEEELDDIDLTDFIETTEIEDYLYNDMNEMLYYE